MHKTNAPKSTHLYRDSFHFEPLELDSENYQKGGTGPVQFDVIDTSNLIDHVESLSLFTASSPLLKNDLSATLYTEKLVKSLTTEQERANSLLGGDLPTISMLLGLSPVDFVTNASAVCTGIDLCLEFETADEFPPTVQTHIRIVWKRPTRSLDSLGLAQRLEKITFDPHGLAQVLYRIYLDMF